MTERRPLNLVLVHGTWADGLPAAASDAVRAALRLRSRARPTSGQTYWYQTGHPFGARLQQAFEARGVAMQRHEPHMWSGANTFTARTEAGLALAATLASLQGPTLVIGHSHGGSVALHALAALDARRAAEIDLVTLNTPFLRSLPCVSPVQSTAFVALGVVAMVTHAATQASAQGIGIADLISLDRFTTNQLLIMTVVSLAVPGLALVVSHWFEQRVIARHVTRFCGRRLQCIRGVSDEATLVISGGLIASGLSRLAYGVVGALARQPWASALGMLLLVTVLSAVFGVFNAPGLLQTTASVLRAVSVSAMVLWVLSSLGNGLLGAEFAAVGLLYIGSIDSTPDAPAGTLRVDTLAVAQGTADGMRHSAVYEQPAVAELIADAMAGPAIAVASRPVDPAS